MCQSCRAIAAAWWLVLGLTLDLSPSPAWAQFGVAPAELSSAVSMDEADSAVRAHLERARAYVADQQYDEAVETLRQVMESHGAKMVPLVPSRYVNLADYCHVQIAALPPEALALYRQRVDPVAETWYREGLERRSAARLAEVVDQMFCSSWGDDALLSLGEIELEQGHYGAARTAWQRLIEAPPVRVSAEKFAAALAEPDLAADQRVLLEKWYAQVPAAEPPVFELRGDDLLTDEAAAKLVDFWKGRRVPLVRLAYPGTELPRADVRARLILVSIMEGSLARARDELAAFTQLHPDASGRLGGRQVRYAEALEAMIASAASWPEPKPADDWLTFAGTPARNKVATRNFDLGAKAWEPISLGEPLAADSSNSRAYSLRRIGEDTHRLLSYYPVVAGNLVLVNNQSQIFAYDVKTGQPAWPSSEPMRPPGEIYADKAALAFSGRSNRGLGVPRFTMTVHDNKLFARMGTPVTSRPLETLDSRSGYLLCLDLSAQGRAVWKPDGRLLPDDERWAFEGSPVVDGQNLYVAMRKSDVRPQAHVACYDIETGRRRWRTLVCSAETAGGGQYDELSHNLLTLAEGTLYYNTNLGAVAAISPREGRVQWVTLYRRARKAGPDGQDRRTAHFYRDVNPCIYDRGALHVAPADCESIFALDAGGGEMLWESHLPEDVVHLLGVGHGNLLASGDSLWWIDARRGKVVKHWPDTTPLGYGRGILTGDEVVWPTRDALYVFDQRVGVDAGTEIRAPREPIPLSAGRGATGGNLVAARGLLLIATSDKLFAFRQTGAEPAAGSRVAARPIASPAAPVPTATPPP